MYELPNTALSGSTRLGVRTRWVSSAMAPGIYLHIRNVEVLWDVNFRTKLYL